MDWKQSFIYVAACFIVLLLAGCTQSIQSIKSVLSQSPPERVLVKNYTLNERKFVAVGEQVVVHKDYYVVKRAAGKFIPSEDFSIAGRSFNISGKKNDSVPLQGVIEDEGMVCYLLPLNCQPGTICVSLLIDPDGHPTKKVVLVNNDRRLAAKPVDQDWLVITPAHIKFKLGFEEAVDKSVGFTNFELIYTGKNSQSMTFLYREYTPEDMVRAAYSQNLIYGVDSRIVKFRKIKLKIEKTTDEGIEYYVVED